MMKKYTYVGFLLQEAYVRVHLDVVRGVDYFGKAARGSVIRYPVRHAERE